MNDHMPKHTIFPKKPFIGVDCSGQPRNPPMIAVATRWSRRELQHKFSASVEKEKIEEFSLKYRDWQEKLYASLFYKVIDKILVAKYEIHIDREFPKTKTRTQVQEYITRLFGMIHSGDPDRENPKITFHTRRRSIYVKDADKKTKLARKGKMRIDDPKASIDWLMRLLE